MQNFRFQFARQVGVADVNYGGHVSNAAVLNFFQDARIAYLAKLGPFSELDLGGCGMIMPEAKVYYHREMFLGDLLTVALRAEPVKRTRIRMFYRVTRHEQLTAEGETLLGCFDYNRRKPCPTPADFLAALVNFEQL